MKLRSSLQAFSALVWIVFSMTAYAAKDCSVLVPPGGAYDYMRDNLTTHARDYLNEVSYIKDFGSSDEASDAGISLSIPVYDTVATLGGKYQTSKKAEWQKEFLSTRNHDVENDVHRLTDKRLLNVAVVKIIADCIKMTDTGLWLSVHVTGSCQFSVRAGYSPIAVGEKRVGTISAPGATCGKLPNQPLPPKGFVVDCQRKTLEPVHVTVHNPQVGDAEDDVPGVAEPAKPVFQFVDTSQSTNVAVSRGQAVINWGPLNCPDCQTLYGIKFGVPGRITSVQSPQGVPPGVVGCPDGGKCGRIPRQYAQTDGTECIGNSSCLAWFLERHDNTPAAITFGVNYVTTSSMCVASCRTNTLDEAAETAAYKTAHDAWDRSKANVCKL